MRHTRTISSTLRRRRLRRAKKNETPFSKPLQVRFRGSFFQSGACHGLGAKTRNRAKIFPNLTSFLGVGARSFQTQIRIASSAPKPLNSRNFPFPVSSFKHQRPPNIGRRKNGAFPSRRDGRRRENGGREGEAEALPSLFPDSREEDLGGCDRNVFEARRPLYTTLVSVGLRLPEQREDFFGDGRHHRREQNRRNAQGLRHVR